MALLRNTSRAGYGLTVPGVIGCEQPYDLDIQYSLEDIVDSWRTTIASPRRPSAAASLNAQPDVYKTMQTEPPAEPSGVDYDYDQYYSWNSGSDKGTDKGTDKTDTEPTAQEYASAAGALIKAVGAAYSYHEQMKAQSAVYKAKASIASDNAELMQLGAEYAYKRGETQLAAITQKYARIRANQMTAYAARGAALGVGSTAEVAASSQLQKEVDVITAKQNALADAWGYKRKKLMYEAEAQIDNKLAGKYASWAHFGLY